MCLLLLEKGLRVDEFLFCDTGYEFPECYEALAHFEKLSGQKITRIKAEHGFDWYCYEKSLKRRDPTRTHCKNGNPCRSMGYGWPSPMRRWCTRHLKIEVINKHLKKHEGKNLVQYIGIAADEPKRVRDDQGLRYPLYEWGVTEEQALRLCKEKGFYKSPCAYDFVKRVSCYICPLQSFNSIYYLIEQRPELWAKIKAIEAKANEPWKCWENRGTEYFEKRFIQHKLQPIQEEFNF